MSLHVVSGKREYEDSPADEPSAGEEYRALFEIAPDVIYSLSADDGTFVALNPAFEELTGWPAEEWIGKAFTGIIHPDDLPLAATKFREGLSGKPSTTPYELRIRSRSGDYLVGEFRSVPRYEDGRVVGKIGIARDITERKRVEYGLRFLSEAGALMAESLDYDTTLVNIARLAVVHIATWCAIDVVQPDGSIRRLATAHRDPDKEALLAEIRARYSVIRFSEWGPASVIESGRGELYPELTEDMLAKSAQDAAHLQMLRSLRPRSAMTLPMPLPDRTIGAITFVSSEDGPRYTATDLALAGELARRAAIAADNARLYCEAQEALRVRDEFMAIASHELRTPLTSLRLQMQLIQRTLNRESTVEVVAERAGHAVEAAERQVMRLAGLVDELLDVSRIAAGRLDLDRGRVDLGALAETVVARFVEECESSGSEIRLQVGGCIVGTWDDARLDQVLTNLISNAMKYGAGHPIDVVVETVDNRARISVRDRGLGIPPEHREEIFERYVRVHEQRQYKGLGLGLYITRQILEAHGGTIGVTSEVGRGSTFIVELPLE